MGPGRAWFAAACLAIGCAGPPTPRAAPPPAPPPPEVAIALPDAAPPRDPLAPHCHEVVGAVAADGYVSVATAADFSCAVRADGALFCWGDQLSTVVSGATGEPIAINGVSDARCVAAGLWTACALLRDGTVSCWGSAFDTNHSGVGNRPATPIHGLDDVAQIAVGIQPCALRRSGEVVCWTRESWAPTTGAPVAPTPIEGIDDAVDLAAGAAWACARRAGGRVSCWELDDWDGPAFQPVDVPDLLGATAIDIDYAVHAITATGEVVRWHPGPLAAEPLAGWTDATGLALQQSYGCILDGAGAVRCGALPLAADTAADASPPTARSDVAAAAGLVLGGYLACALLATGDVTCWQPRPDAAAAIVPLPR
jgi:hypothetical protein